MFHSTLGAGLLQPRIIASDGGRRGEFGERTPAAWAPTIARVTVTSRPTCCSGSFHYRITDRLTVGVLTNFYNNFSMSWPTAAQEGRSRRWQKTPALGSALSEPVRRTGCWVEDLLEASPPPPLRVYRAGEPYGEVIDVGARRRQDRWWYQGRTLRWYRVSGAQPIVP